MFKATCTFELKTLNAANRWRMATGRQQLVLQVLEDPAGLT
jgi:hypothetical protein